MASRLEGRLVRLERLSGAPVAGGKPDAPCECWRWLTGVMEIPTPEPEPGMTMRQWVGAIPDEALWALLAAHDIADRLEAEAETLEAEGATTAHFVAAVRRRIDERYRPHPMTLRWRNSK